MKNVPIKKNKEYVVDIIDDGYEGEGIAKIEGFTIFVPGAIKGEKVKILIVKVLSSHGFGKILDIIEKSKNRIDPDCDTYKRCGGCSLRHIEYEETLNIKQRAVQNLVNKSLKTKIEVKPTWAMGNPYNYRNKLQYPVGVDKKGEPVIGVYANRTHEIIPTNDCMLQNKRSNKIANHILELIKKYRIPVYNEETREGILRHIVIRKAFRKKDTMVIFVINGDFLPFASSIAKELFGLCQTVVVNINKKNTNVILGEKNISILGDGYIFDELGEYLFVISPNSFYQVNPVQAEILYNIALENARITKDDIVFDLYCRSRYNFNLCIKIC